MNKGATPQNYDLRNRLIPKLLRPSEFTQPGHSTSTPKATAPLYQQNEALIPTTSLLLDGAATTYTSPVTIYPPLTTVQTILTNSTTTTPGLAPAFQPSSDIGSTDLMPPTPSPPPITQRPTNLTTTFGSPSHLQSLFGTTSPAPVISDRTFLTVPLLTIPKTFPVVSEHKSSSSVHLTLTPPEHFSRNNIFGPSRFSHTASRKDRSRRDC